MIGPEYATAAARALLGDTRGGAIPAVLWLTLLADDVELGARTAVPNTDAVWGDAEGGATNIASIEWGTATGAWTIDAVALFDRADGGALVLSALLVDPVTGTPEPAQVAASSPVTIAPGGLVVTVT